MKKRTAIIKPDPRGGMASDYMESFDIKSSTICDKCGIGRPAERVEALGWYQRELMDKDTEDVCPKCQDEYLRTVAQNQARRIVNEELWSPAINLERMIRTTIPSRLADLKKTQEKIIDSALEAVKNDYMDDNTHQWILKRMATAIHKVKETYYGTSGKSVIGKTSDN